MLFVIQHNRCQNFASWLGHCKLTAPNERSAWRELDCSVCESLRHHSLVITQLWRYVTSPSMDPGSLLSGFRCHSSPPCEKLFFIWCSSRWLLSAYSRGPKSRNESCIILDWLEYCTAGGWKWDLPSKDCLQRVLLRAAFGRSHTERKHTLWPHNYIFIINSFDVVVFFLPSTSILYLILVAEVD